ncbi:hypothetical protein RBTH_04011 [Bacillus thuringiensis serovar israelensis ATCC 35646]|nr:hypothetical protein RBTH_04011 [Bacillus thuringiensis serovar israelensis ATCC 35646]
MHLYKQQFLITILSKHRNPQQVDFFVLFLSKVREIIISCIKKAPIYFIPMRANYGYLDFQPHFIRFI